jgi:hypothetical protein
MDVCVRVVLFVGSGLQTRLISHPRSYTDSVQIKKVKKKAAKFHKGCRAIDR